MKRFSKHLLLATMACLTLTGTIRADVKLPAFFGDHMVLQQNEEVSIWGWAEPGEKVTVKADWAWEKKTTQADENGRWKVTLKVPKAGKTGTLTIKGNNEIVLDDILFGEVWICSGQSNMEWTMQKLGTDRGNQDIKKADWPQIRLFTVKKALATRPKEDVNGQWQICSPETVGGFSAAGYYFGKNLYEKLDVPIGLISTNWGGTKAEAWTSRQTLADFEPFKDQLELTADPDTANAARKTLFEKQLAEWENKIAKSDKGIQEKWFATNFDDSGWSETTLPSTWTGTELAEIDGIVWYRRTFDLPPSWANTDLKLHLGAIDDIASVWVNGTALGTTTGWDQKRIYQIPISILKTGSNTVAVRVIDLRGEGGFSGVNDDMRIGPKNADVKGCSPLAGTWRYQLSYNGAVPEMPTNHPSFNQNTPTVLYNGMIAPLIPFRIAGVIWYQGESNCYNPILYRTLFPAMITDWRTQWGQGDFPFYYVQIAPYEYGPKRGPSQAIREAQMMTLDAVPNVGMAVTMDIGNEKDIHPRNKHDVGDRLARWALAKIYGKKETAYSGPIYKDMTVENGKIRISFDYAEGGLTAKDSGLTAFEIAGEDQKFVPAQAVIDGDTLVISSDKVKNPVAVRYGWSNWVDGSLFNGAGLPASSFRTDDWPLE